MRHESVGLPDAHRIAPRLHQGAHVVDGHALARLDFTMVVLCAVELQPRSYGAKPLKVVRCQLDDARDYFSGDVAGKRWRRVDEAVDAAVAELGRSGRIYVSCNMGLNRSGVVVASILRRLWPAERMTRIIEHVQRARFSRQFALPALFNPHFVEALLARDAARIARTKRRSKP